MFESTPNTKGSHFGRASQADPSNDTLKWAWDQAARLGAEKPEGAEGEFVPIAAIRVRDEILPRERTDDDAIQRYQLRIDLLPPVKVQRGTFVLIGGKHRILAAHGMNRAVIRIVEVDCPDDQLWKMAFEDNDENDENGLPLKLPERLLAARRGMQAHPDWSDAAVAQWAGVHRSTIATWRREQADALAARAAPAAGSSTSAPSTYQPVTRRDGSRNPARDDGRDRVRALPSAQRTTSAPTKRVININLEAVLDYPVSEAVEGVPQEAVQSQITKAFRIIRWLEVYIEGLQERQREAEMSMPDDRD